jgi:hypothetical protein
MSNMETQEERGTIDLGCYVVATAAATDK